MTNGFFRRGWVCVLDGRVTIRHRVRFDYTGVKGSASRLPPDHPPWLVTGVIGHKERWFSSLEEAMVWAQGELSMRETKELL